MQRLLSAEVRNLYTENGSLMASLAVAEKKRDGGRRERFEHLVWGCLGRKCGRGGGVVNGSLLGPKTSTPSGRSTPVKYEKYEIAKI